jgi:hypothetical protein
MGIKTKLSREQTTTKSDFKEAHVVISDIHIRGDKMRCTLHGYADKDAFDALMDQANNQDMIHMDNNGIIFRSVEEVPNLAPLKYPDTLTGIVDTVTEIAEQHLISEVFKSGKRVAN